MKERVVVAMSGGVDSSVAAALLKEVGYEVIGLTMCFNLSDAKGKRPICCGIQGIEDARRVAHKLGIRHYVLNMQRSLEEWVIKDFCREYSLGKTPNPCIRCNQYLKFGVLLKKALSLDAQFLATGHYARIVRGQGIGDRGQGGMLKKARDLKKDQSYFLYRLTQNQLRHTLFPLADYTKDEVRKIARRFSLPVAEKLASQEICFLPNQDYRQFLKTRIRIEPGQIVDKQENILGKHQGIAYYTIGQREGLGIARGYPVYITKIDPKNNQLTVGKREEVLKKEFLVIKPHFIAGTLKKKVALKVKIRYNHQEMPAQITPAENKLKVEFKVPQFAVTPGQAAVFYKQDTVVGGGIIDRVLG